MLSSPSQVLKSVCFDGFAPPYRRLAFQEGKDMGGFVCAAHRRKNRGFPTLKRTLNLGIEKGRLLKNSRPKGGLIQVIFYPASPETVDITGFFEKFCIAIRTKIDSLLFGENLFLYGIPSAEVLWFCESKIVPIPIGTK